MHSETLLTPISINPITNTNNEHDDHDFNSHTNGLNSISTTNNNSLDQDDDHNNDESSQIPNEIDHDDDDDHDGEITQTSTSERPRPIHHDEIALSTDPEPDAVTDNNPPESFWVSTNKVTDWLNQHTFIERKASVKLVAVSKKFDQSQTRSSQRSISFNQKPQTTMIGFRQKPGHNSDSKSKQNDRQDLSLRLFKNRSVPGKSSGQQVVEPRSPRVSCTGRVGSMRGRARKTGFWKNVKAAILNRVRSNKANGKDQS